MNVRHIELFYHVVKHQGINRAVGRMPIPIQQSALSEQIKALEDDLGCRLFERKPFRLTPKGQMLFRKIKGLFEELEQIEPQLRDPSPHYRIVADEALIRRYATPVLSVLQKEIPGAWLTLLGGTGDRVVQLLRDGEVDLAISTLPPTRFKGLASRQIASRELVLMVRNSSNVRSAQHFWNAGKISEPLIVPDATDGVAEAFQQGLKRGGLTWAPRILTSSVGSIAPCVAGGAGVGVTLGVSYMSRHPNTRALPLAGFDPVTFSAVWRAQGSVQLRPLLAAIRKCVDA